METLASQVKHLTLAWIKAHVGTEGNKQADQTAKKGAAGGAYILKQIKTPIPWQVAKNKIEEYTTNKWTGKWNSDPQYKHTKLFHTSRNKNQAKHMLKMGSYTIRTCIKSITGHNNLAHF